MRREFEPSHFRSRLQQSRTVLLICLSCLAFAGGLSADEKPAHKKLTLGANEPGENAEYRIYAELSKRGGGVTRLQLNRYRNEQRDGPFVLLREEIAGAHSYMLSTAKHPEIVNSVWEVVADSPEKVSFRTHVRGGALRIEKRFLLEKNSHLIKLQVVFQNLRDEPLQGINYSFSAGSGLPIENLDSTIYYRNAVVATIEDDGSTALWKGSAIDIDLGNFGGISGVPVRFWGVDCQYFASVVINPPGKDADRRINVVEPIMAKQPSVEQSDVTMIAGVNSFDLPARGEVVHEYLLYNGPKDRPLLDEYAQYELPLLVKEGNFLFIPIRYIARPVNELLRIVSSTIGDYGLGLIVITIFIRVCLLPLSRRQRRGIAVMEHLKPKIDELKQKHGKDRQAMAKAQMELFRRYNYNPSVGCLFVVIIGLLFVGAWRGLLNSFALRQAEFLWGASWIHDLSAPDRLFSWGENVVFLGSHFNLLPTLAAGFAIAGYFMQPPDRQKDSANPKRGLLISLFFCVICYTMPSASWLCFLTYFGVDFFERVSFPKPDSEEIEAQALEPSAVEEPLGDSPEPG